MPAASFPAHFEIDCEWQTCRDCRAVWEAFPPVYARDPVCAEPCDNCAFRPGSPEQADPERWKRVEANAPAKPVILYPRPTVFSAHPLLSLVKESDGLIDALMSDQLLELAWQDHGFRGPLETLLTPRAAQ